MYPYYIFFVYFFTIRKEETPRVQSTNTRTRKALSLRKDSKMMSDNGTRGRERALSQVGDHAFYIPTTIIPLLPLRSGALRSSTIGVHTIALRVTHTELEPRGMSHRFTRRLFCRERERRRKRERHVIPAE